MKKKRQTSRKTIATRAAKSDAQAMAALTAANATIRELAGRAAAAEKAAHNSAKALKNYKAEAEQRLNAMKLSQMTWDEIDEDAGQRPPTLWERFLSWYKGSQRRAA
jgi:hypothetical protein